LQLTTALAVISADAIVRLARGATTPADLDRRGLCRRCQKTFTVLPDWSPPSGQYSFHCRQQGWELLRQADGNWERSIPDIADASRSPDPSTVRRWAERLLHLGTLLATEFWRATGWSISISPTILAWDWTAIRRILPLEARSP
jgi:hypothetical protein